MAKQDCPIISWIGPSGWGVLPDFWSLFFLTWCVKEKILQIKVKVKKDKTNMGEISIKVWKLSNYSDSLAQITMCSNLYQVSYCKQSVTLPHHPKLTNFWSVWVHACTNEGTYQVEEWYFGCLKSVLLRLKLEYETDWWVFLYHLTGSP